MSYDDWKRRDDRRGMAFVDWLACVGTCLAQDGYSSHGDLDDAQSMFRDGWSIEAAAGHFAERQDGFRARLAVMELQGPSGAAEPA